MPLLERQRGGPVPLPAVPRLAAEALLLEHSALALNPNMSLYRDGTLRDVLAADGNARALALYEARLAACPWAAYRVRRIYRAKGNADREVRKLCVGSRQDVAAWLR